MPAPAKNSAGYRRVLSGFDATMLVIGSIIGGGVFFTPNDMARVTQEPGIMLAAWFLGGLIAMTGALTYSELGGMYRRAGGVYVFLRDAFGGLPGFLYGWALLLVIAPGALALVADFFAANLATLAPGLGARGQKALAIGSILLLTALNIRGVRWGSAVQNVVTVAKLIPLALLIVGGTIYAADPVPPPAGANVPSPSHAGWAALGLAMMPVLFSYGGWQNGTYIAAEVKRPGRNVPLAILAGTVVVLATYLGVNAAYLRVLQPETIASTRTFATLAAEAAWGPSGGTLVAVGIVISTFGICAAILLTNPRVAQAIGQDGLFFRAFGRLHPSFRTPHLAILVLGLWACVLSLVGAAGQLIHSVVFADWVFFAMTAAALFVLRRTRPDTERPYRCPGYPWVPGLFLLLATTMAVLSFIKADATARLLGPGLLAAGIPVYFAFRRTTGGEPNRHANGPGRGPSGAGP